jgi:hypothetical protein
MDPELQLRELMMIDAKIYRVRNQIAEKTDPHSTDKRGKQNKKAYAKAKAKAEVKPDAHPTEEPPQCTDT